MKPSWKKYLLYGSLIIVGGGLIFILVETIRAKNTGFDTKTLWDWMELLIIPFVLAIGAFYLNRSERAVERQIAENRIKEDRQLAEDRAKLEREIAKDHQQEAALQAYIDRMSELLLKEKLRTTEVEEVRDVARTRTISILRGLDTLRNNQVIQFLREAKLIIDENSILNGAIMYGMNLEGLNFWGVFLKMATLSKATMQRAFLLEANLQGAHLNGANLQGAYLYGANLQGANLNSANLQGAYLYGANLQGSDLEWADLTGVFSGVGALYTGRSAEKVFSGVNLQGAFLYRANLQGADLYGANLQGANLNSANLKGAVVTYEQLALAKSLEGAIMPDGTKHE